MFYLIDNYKLKFLNEKKIFFIYKEIIILDVILKKFDFFLYGF